MLSGVRQESNMGPLLFHIYVHEQFVIIHAVIAVLFGNGQLSMNHSQIDIDCPYLPLVPTNFLFLSQANYIESKRLYVNGVKDESLLYDLPFKTDLEPNAAPFQCLHNRKYPRPPCSLKNYS